MKNKYLPNPIATPIFDSLEMAKALAGENGDALEAIEKNTIQCALHQVEGDQIAASRILGITPTEMYSKCKHHRLRPCDRLRVVS